jgi:alcohol dehydrogenase class IV
MIAELKKKAYALLKDFRGDRYIHGLGYLDQIGELCRGLGKRVLIVADSPETDWMKKILAVVESSLKGAELQAASRRNINGARPNAPREDVYRIEAEILHFAPDFIVVIGGGSTIDAVKAANALSTFGQQTNDIEAYFGSGNVTRLSEESGRKPRPVVAIMVAASSSAHLTKYSNITDPAAGQKKLIVDEIVVPTRALFDYSVTESSPMSLTLDGGMDGIAHSLEVYYGARDNLEKIREIALTGIELVVSGLEQVKKDPGDMAAREVLGLATDLGGYSIMVGGTNGGHLTSFSLVDIVSHGRACALLNPYYTVFFAPAIEDKLRDVGEIYRRHGYIQTDLTALKGRELGIEVAQGMITLSKATGFPVTLKEVPGFSQDHIQRALTAAKNPQLEMKLKNMPVPLNASLIDEYMGPILEAAKSGDLGLIKTMN